MTHWNCIKKAWTNEKRTKRTTQYNFACPNNNVTFCHKQTLFGNKLVSNTFRYIFISEGNWHNNIITHIWGYLTIQFEIMTVAVVWLTESACFSIGNLCLLQDVPFMGAAFKFVKSSKKAQNLSFYWAFPSESSKLSSGFLLDMS